jgi:formylglycine-generating enzyme required for sulfatase activity
MTLNIPRKMLIVGLSFTFSIAAHALGMVDVDAGEYRPLYLSEDSPMVKVNRFWLDITPVTNNEFFTFVKQDTKWRKSKIASLFAEQRYLAHWQTISKVEAEAQSIEGPSISQMTSPVNHVSWFASQAYCQAQGKRLPTVAEWERAGSASETQANGGNEDGYNQKILQWYSKPTNTLLAQVAQQEPNFWGVHDMHGLIWEWTEDFNSNLSTGESRGDSSLDQNLFCGSGAAGAADPSDYAAFMRFAFRGSLKAAFTQTNLGFRCASDKEIKR